MYGAHLKASAAMVRLRLYDILALLPPKTYEGTVSLDTCSTTLAQNLEHLIDIFLGGFELLRYKEMSPSINIPNSI